MGEEKSLRRVNDNEAKITREHGQTTTDVPLGILK